MLCVRIIEYMRLRFYMRLGISYALADAFIRYMRLRVYKGYIEYAFEYMLMRL